MNLLEESDIAKITKITLWLWKISTRIWSGTIIKRPSCCFLPTYKWPRNPGKS